MDTADKVTKGNSPPLETVVKRLILDLTAIPKSKFPRWWGDGPLEIPVTPSAHGMHKFDVIEKELPPQWVKKVRARKLRVQFFPTEKAKKDAMAIPLGVNLADFPDGARIVDA